MFQLDLRSRESIYEQVVNNVKEQIITGILKADDKLPSVRELSKTLTVNPNTIQKSYKELENQGYIYIVSGLGAFVSSPAEVVIDEKKVVQIKGRIRNEISELLYLGFSVDKINNLLNELLKERSDWK